VRRERRREMEILRPAPYTHVKMIMPLCQVCQSVKAEYIVVRERQPRLFLCRECMENLRQVYIWWEGVEAEMKKKEEGGDEEGD